MALISDAGTPLVSDPGYKLVRAASRPGTASRRCPGLRRRSPGLSVAGLPTDAFFFAGFLPPKSAARRARIAELKAVPATLVFFEAPSRVAETLADLAAVLGDRPAALARELTKLHEEVLRAHACRSSPSSSAQTPSRARPSSSSGRRTRARSPTTDIVAQLEPALREMSLRDAAKAVADALGVPKSRVYDLGLARERTSE